MRTLNTLIFIAILIAFIILPKINNAQVNGINYQAVAVDENGKEIAGMDIQGNIIPDKAINVRFSILSSSATGAVLYQETHTTYTDSHGMFSLVIGQGFITNAGLYNNILNIDWSTTDQWLKVEIDFKGTNEYKLMGAQKLLSVPFAYYALNAKNGFSGNYNDLTNKPNIPAAQVQTDWNATTGMGVLLNKPAIPLAQVNSDWNSTNGLSQILNKPIIPPAQVQTDWNATTGMGVLLNKPTMPAAQVNSDWNATTGLSQILNKPTLFDGTWTSLTGKPSLWDSTWATIKNKPNFASIATSGSYTDLSNTPSIPAAQVNSDWNSVTGLSQILNKPTLFDGNYNSLTNKPTLFDGTWNSLNSKPTLSTVATSGSYNDLSNKPTTFSGAYSDLTGKPTLWDSTWASIKNKPTLFDGTWTSLSGKPTFSTVATSGSYTDLSNQPSLFNGNYNSLTNKPTLWDSTYASIKNKPTLATVATSGSYTDLSNQPTIPSAQVNSDWNSVTGLSQILNKPTLFDGTWTSLTGKPTLSTVATSGSYTDLSNKPTIPAAQVQTDWNSVTGLSQILNKPTLFDGNYNSLTNKPTLFDGTWTSLTGKPALSTVATSGSYTDLSNLPILFSGSYSDLIGKPSLWDSTWLSIKNKPTLFDGQYSSLLGSPTLATVAISGNYNDLNNIPVIPTQTNQLINNSGFITNELQILSISNDTLFLTGGSFVKLPAGFSGNYNDLINKPIIDGSETKVTSGTNVTVTGAGTTASPYIINTTSSNLTGTTNGDLQYWNGTAWLILHPGTSGQVLTINNSNLPSWQNTTTVFTPQLTTTSVSSISFYTATSGGTIIADGGFTVTERGVCWSTGITPTILDSKTTDGTGGGNFTSNITGLIPNTTYYIRAYATNSNGTNYGMTLSFNTLPPILPTLTTATIGNISATTATSGGNISSDGAATIIARGVCWSIFSNPTITDSKTTDSTGIGIYNSSINGLMPGTTYYVRAYATNSVGTSYGNQVNFTTGGIGVSYQGGIIAYILQSGDPGYIVGQVHGLIAAPSDQSTGIQWYNGSPTITGATGTALGTGLANTNAIIANQGAGSYAAKLCHDLSLGGYSDWYLPSKDELNLLNSNKVLIGGFSNSSYYWSSTDGGNVCNDGNNNFTDCVAWCQLFSDGSQYARNKYYPTFYVRAIRNF
ncbi:MAG: DUF1566 domain-containing protein [Bacteroidota bacterium]